MKSHCTWFHSLDVRERFRVRRHLANPHVLERQCAVTTASNRTQPTRNPSLVVELVVAGLSRFVPQASQPGGAKPASDSCAVGILVKRGGVVSVAGRRPRRRGALTFRCQLRRTKGPYEISQQINAPMLSAKAHRCGSSSVGRARFRANSRQSDVQPLRHNSYRLGKNPVAAGSGERFRGRKWRSGVSRYPTLAIHNLLISFILV